MYWVQVSLWRESPFTHLQLSSMVGWRYEIIHQECMLFSVCYSFPWDIFGHLKNRMAPRKKNSAWKNSPHPPSLSSRTPFASSVVSPQNASDPFQAKNDEWFKMASLVIYYPCWSSENEQNMLKQQTAKTWNKLIWLKVSKLHQPRNLPMDGSVA